MARRLLHQLNMKWDQIHFGGYEHAPTAANLKKCTQKEMRLINTITNSTKSDMCVEDILSVVCIILSEF